MDRDYPQLLLTAQTSYPQVAPLKQIKGVGTLIALTFLMTLEDPHRFRKGRDEASKAAMVAATSRK